MLPNGLLQMIVSWSLGIVSFLTLCGWGCFRLVVVVREPLVSCSRRGQSSVAVLLPRAPAAPKARVGMPPGFAAQSTAPPFRTLLSFASSSTNLPPSSTGPPSQVCHPQISL